MTKPYVPTKDSTNGLYVSLRTDEAILPRDLSLGCNHCWNGLSNDDLFQAFKAGEHPDLEWDDRGDDGVLCPACRRPAPVPV